MNLLELLAYLERVPAIIWSALLASALTLTGVMLSNRSNTKRLITQLEHDASQKTKDRMATLHREVYLKLAEEMARASSFLGRLSQIDPAKENIASGLSELFAVGAKAQLIAQPETSKLVAELTAQYGEVVMRLLGEISPIQRLNTKIRSTSELLEHSHAEANRALAEMKRINESGISDPVRIDALSRSIDNSMQAADRLSDEREQHWDAHEEALRNFNIALLDQLHTIGPLQARVMTAIRAELGLGSGGIDPQKAVDESWRRMDALLRETMGRIAQG